MNPQSVLKLAWQGDPQAIQALINQHLQPKNISSEVAVRDGELLIGLQGFQNLNEKVLTAFLTAGIKKVNIQRVSTLTIYAYEVGSLIPLWTQTVELKPKLAGTTPSAGQTAALPPQLPGETPGPLATSPLPAQVSPVTTESFDKPRVTSLHFSNNDTEFSQVGFLCSLGLAGLIIAALTWFSISRSANQSVAQAPTAPQQIPQAQSGATPDEIQEFIRIIGAVDPTGDLITNVQQYGRTDLLYLTMGNVFIGDNHVNQSDFAVTLRDIWHKTCNCSGQLVLQSPAGQDLVHINAQGNPQFQQ